MTYAEKFGRIVCEKNNQIVYYCSSTREAAQLTGCSKSSVALYVNNNKTSRTGWRFYREQVKDNE